MIAARSNAQLANDLRQQGLLAEIAEFFRQFLVAASDPYRPERHYMRGPGPACRARQSMQETCPGRAAAFQGDALASPMMPLRRAGTVQAEM